MASQKQREASRRNAQKSTGPKTDEGKARASRNGTTHGLTARPENDPTEAGREAYRRRVGSWFDDLRPVGAAQRALVEAACEAAWRMERCREHDRAATEERVRHAAETHEAEARAEAEAVGRPLVEGPDVATDKEGRRYFERDEPGEDPATRLDRLQRTAQGADWLLARWADLGRALDEEGRWEEREKHASVRLLGRRPEEFLNDPVAREVFGCCYALRPDRGRTLHEETYTAIPCGIGGCLHPRRMAHMEAHLPGPGEALRTLKETVRRERARLVRLKETVLDARASADRAGAAERALVDVGPLGERLHRYQAAAGRALSRALADLIKLRKEDQGADDGPEPSFTPEPIRRDPAGGSPGSSDVAPNGYRTEPRATARAGAEAGLVASGKRTGGAADLATEGETGVKDSASQGRGAVLHTEADPPSEAEAGDEDPASEGRTTVLQAEAHASSEGEAGVEGAVSASEPRKPVLHAEAEPVQGGNRRARRAAAKRARS